jgi:hypothetical protein
MNKHQHQRHNPELLSLALLIICSRALQAGATQTLFASFAELRSRNLTQLDLRAPAASDRRATDKLIAAGFAL